MLKGRPVGLKLSADTKDKISKKRKGSKQSEETKRKISRALQIRRQQIEIRSRLEDINNHINVLESLLLCNISPENKTCISNIIKDLENMFNDICNNNGDTII